MWAFATRARPKRKKPFFAISAQGWTLKAPQLATHLKKLGAYFKVDTMRIGTHSLRIGGASTLAAAGLADNEITRIGSWRRSTAFLITYLRQNIELFEKERTAMASGKHLTLEDVRRFNQN
jgi:hypothetical protein